MTVIGAQPDSKLQFGRYCGCTVNKTYVAATDGYVAAGIGPPDDADRFNLAILQGLVDDHVIASTTAGTLGSFEPNWNYMRVATTASFLMPVPAGASWQVKFISHQRSQGVTNSWVNWLPLTTNLPQEVGNVATGQHLEKVCTTSKPWEDFEPATINLVNVLESILMRSFTSQERASLSAAIKQLI